MEAVWCGRMLHALHAHSPCHHGHWASSCALSLKPLISHVLHKEAIEMRWWWTPAVTKEGEVAVMIWGKVANRQGSQSVNAQPKPSTGHPWVQGHSEMCMAG